MRSLVDRNSQCEVIVSAGNDQGLSMKGIVRPADPQLCDQLTRAAELALTSH